MKNSLGIVEEQHALLRSVAGSSVEAAVNISQQWEKFEIMLDSHQMMIKEQVCL